MTLEIPTAVTAEEQDFLTELAAGQFVYEAGALLGASTVALARSASFVISVDPHDGYPRRDPSPTWARFHHNLRKAGVDSRVQPVRATFQDAPPAAAYGLAFADLTGEYDLTAEFLKKTAHLPMVAVHDYQRSGCTGATRAVDEAIRKYKPRAVTRVGMLILLEYGR